MGRMPSMSPGGSFPPGPRFFLLAVVRLSKPWRIGLPMRPGSSSCAFAGCRVPKVGRRPVIGPSPWADVVCGRPAIQGADGKDVFCLLYFFGPLEFLSEFRSHRKSLAQPKSLTQARIQRRVCSAPPVDKLEVKQWQVWNWRHCARAQVCLCASSFLCTQSAGWLIAGKTEKTPRQLPPRQFGYSRQRAKLRRLASEASCINIRSTFICVPRPVPDVYVAAVGETPSFSFSCASVSVRYRSCSLRLSLPIRLRHRDSQCSLRLSLPIRLRHRDSQCPRTFILPCRVARFGLLARRVLTF